MVEVIDENEEEDLVMFISNDFVVLVAACITSAISFAAAVIILGPYALLKVYPKKNSFLAKHFPYWILPDVLIGTYILIHVATWSYLLVSGTVFFIFKTLVYIGVLFSGRSTKDIIKVGVLAFSVQMLPILIIGYLEWQDNEPRQTEQYNYHSSIATFQESPYIAHYSVLVGNETTQGEGQLYQLNRQQKWIAIAKLPPKIISITLAATRDSLFLIGFEVSRPFNSNQERQYLKIFRLKDKKFEEINVSSRTNYSLGENFTIRITDRAIFIHTYGELMVLEDERSFYLEPFEEGYAYQTPTLYERKWYIVQNGKFVEINWNRETAKSGRASVTFSPSPIKLGDGKSIDGSFVLSGRLYAISSATIYRYDKDRFHALFDFPKKYDHIQSIILDYSGSLLFYALRRYEQSDLIIRFKSGKVSEQLTLPHQCEYPTDCSLVSYQGVLWISFPAHGVFRWIEERRIWERTPDIPADRP